MTTAQDVEKLTAISELAQKQMDFEEQVAVIEARLEFTKKQLNQIRCEALPAAMEEAGLIEFTLETGQKIKLSTTYTVSLAGEYREPAINWLVEVGMENVISREFIQSFSRDDLEGPKRLRQLFKNAGIHSVERENVNTGTFKAIVREFLEDGKDVPIAKLGVVALTATTITTPKRK